MKKTFILLMAGLISASISGQDFKVKKGIVSIDDVPTLKMVGDCGLFKKLDYSILSMSDDTLLKMKEESIDFVDPRIESLHWYELLLKNNDQAVRTKAVSRLVSDKQVVKYIYSFKPAIIANGTLDNDAVSKFISEQDITASLISDTTTGFGFDRAQSKAIQSNNQKRDLNAKIEFWQSKNKYTDVLESFSNYSVLFGNVDYTVFDIYQDGMFLGIIVQGNKQKGTEVKTVYYFMKKLEIPFLFENIKHEFGMIAYLEDINSSGLETMYIADLGGFMSKATDTNQKLVDYVKHLVQLGCL